MELKPGTRVRVIGPEKVTSGWKQYIGQIGTVHCLRGYYYDVLIDNHGPIMFLPEELEVIAEVQTGPDAEVAGGDVDAVQRGLRSWDEGAHPRRNG